MTKQLFINIDKPVKKKKKRKSTIKTTERLLKLLLYLNPDATNVKDITAYLYGRDTPRNRRSVYSNILRLRKDGWIISKNQHRLDSVQYVALRDAYAKRGNNLNLTRLEPDVIAGITITC